MLSEPEANPYTPPQAVAGAAAAERPRATKLAKTGAWMQVPVPLAMMWTVFGVLSALSPPFMRGWARDLGGHSGVIAKLAILVPLGLWSGLIGCVLLGVAVFSQRNQSGWLKAIFWLAVLPALYATFMLVMAVLSALRGGNS